MWVSAILGMATKYAEAVCAVHYREKNAKAEFVGGPMYYIKNGLPKHFAPLAVAFAVFAALAGFGIGNAVQAHSIATAVEESFGIAPVWVSLILGIAATAKKLVPLMAGIYLLAGLVVIVFNLSAVPDALATIVKTAFMKKALPEGFFPMKRGLAVRPLRMPQRKPIVLWSKAVLQC